MLSMTRAELTPQATVLDAAVRDVAPAGKPRRTRRTSPSASAQPAPAASAQPAPPARPEPAELDDVLAQPSDLRCGSCGYGIASYVTPPVCPMCHETNWQPLPRPRAQPQ